MDGGSKIFESGRLVQRLHQEAGLIPSMIGSSFAWRGTRIVSGSAKTRAFFPIAFSTSGVEWGARSRALDGSCNAGMICRSARTTLRRVS